MVGYTAVSIVGCGIPERSQVDPCPATIVDNLCDLLRTLQYFDASKIPTTILRKSMIINDDFVLRRRFAAVPSAHNA